jgi:hypothetical protein
MKRFELLWRGNHDGFGAKEFHLRCDGCANILTLISDTKGNVSGGFTPVKWESRVWNGKYRDKDNCFKGDNSLESFLFTLRNPRGVPPRKFALRMERNQSTIYCNSECGPAFGTGYIFVYDTCNTTRGLTRRKLISNRDSFHNHICECKPTHTYRFPCNSSEDDSPQSNAITSS